MYRAKSSYSKTNLIVSGRLVILNISMSSFCRGMLSAAVDVDLNNLGVGMLSFCMIEIRLTEVRLQKLRKHYVKAGWKYHRPRYQQLNLIWNTKKED